MQSAMESCPVKSVISGGMGFALGGAFGLFMSSVSKESGRLRSSVAQTNLMNLLHR